MVHTSVLSRFSHVQPFATSWTVACQAPLAMGFLRQGYWSGLSCPPPWDLPDLEFEPASPVSPVSAFQADSLPLSHQGGQPCSPARWIHVKTHIYKQSQLLMTFPP